MKLWHEWGGSGDGPVLVLLHGLGANGEVWDPLKPYLDDWPGRWLIPDLRGHGRSPHATVYSFGAHAADVAELLPEDAEVCLLGHSMGGVVAMTLATGWFGLRVRSAVACGVKTTWTDDEVSRAQAFARSPVRWFDRLDEAVERYLKAAGLFGLIDPASAMALSGVRAEGGRFRLAADPLINVVAGATIDSLIAASKAPVHLGAGANDAMTTTEDLAQYDANAFVIDRAGHNAHVERPEALWRTVLPLLSP